MDATRLVSALALTIVLSGAALAEDAALLLGNDRYQSLGRVSQAGDSLRSGRALEGLGFDVIALRNGDADETRDALVQLLDRSASAERMLVVLTGHFVTDGTRSWFLTADAGRPGIFAMDRTAVSVESILSVLARLPGNAILLLGAEPDENAPLDPWLRQGIGALDVPQGVSVLRGDIRAINDLLGSQLSRPGVDLAGALASSRAITVEGFLPRQFIISPGAAEPVAPSGDEPAWRLALAADTLDAYRAYLRRYPDGYHADEAEQIIAEIIAEPNRADRLAEAALGLTLDQRRDIQNDLTILSYNTRGVDGIFGPGTRRAILNWQQENGYPQTTYLNAEQISRLDAQARLRAMQLEAEAERRRAEAARLDRTYWEETGALGSEAGYRAYLERYPDGLYSEAAADALQLIDADKRRQAQGRDRAAWDDARSADTVASYQAYLRRFPDGVFRPDAESRIAALTQQSREQATMAEAADAEARLNLNPLTMRLVEIRLAQLGLDTGQVDGRFDESTRRAIRRYQRDRELPVTGYLDDLTLVRLLAGAVPFSGR